MMGALRFNPETQQYYEVVSTGPGDVQLVPYSGPVSFVDDGNGSMVPTAAPSQGAQSLVDQIFPDSSVFRYGSELTGGLGPTGQFTNQAVRDFVLQDLASKNGISVDTLLQKLAPAFKANPQLINSWSTGFGPGYLPNEYISNQLASIAGLPQAYSSDAITRAQQRINEFSNRPENGDPGGPSLAQGLGMFLALSGAGGALTGAFGGLGSTGAGAGSLGAAEEAAALTGSLGAGGGGGLTAAGAAGVGGMDDWLQQILDNVGGGLRDLGAGPAQTNLQDAFVKADALSKSLGMPYGQVLEGLTGLPVSGLDFSGDVGLSSGLWNSLTNGTSNLLKALGVVGGGSGIGSLGSGGSGLGALLGALAGGLGANQKPAGTTTTVQDIPDWLKPYVIGNINSAMGAQAQSAARNNAVLPDATAEYLKTINGDYLDPATNPYLDATYKHAAGLVGAGVDSRFEQAGRYGSGAHQGVLQEGLNNLATSIYGGNYQTERGRQAAAAGGAPTYLTGSAGATYAPYSGLNSLFPNVRATSEPYFNNTAGGILSGALAGSQLSKLFG